MLRTTASGRTPTNEAGSKRFAAERSLSGSFLPMTRLHKILHTPCSDCHQIRHCGKSMVDGREEETLRHLMAINGWTLAQAEHATDEAMT